MQATPLIDMKYLADHNLLDALKSTVGYTTIYLPWFTGHRTGWTITTYNGLSTSNKNIFLYLVNCFLCCLGVGLEDWTQGYQIFDSLYDSNIILTLLLKICIAINNNPNSTQCCWFTRIEANDDYLYVTTSKTINHHKKTFRVKAIRLLCGIFRRPSIINGQIDLQGSHLCFMEATCSNPHHIWPQTDKANKDRRTCLNGCAHYCPHNPRCIWTWYTGDILPHRNDPTRAYSKSDCNCTDVNCFYQLNQ